MDIRPKRGPRISIPISGSKPWKALEGQTAERTSHFFSYANTPSSRPTLKIFVMPLQHCLKIRKNAHRP